MMSEPYLSKLMPSHEAAFVYIAINAIEMPLTRVLPHDKVQMVVEHRLITRVLGNHHLVVVKHSKEIDIIEVGIGVNERLLLIRFLHEIEKLEERVTELSLAQPAPRLNVNHRDQVLVTRPALGHKVSQLRLLRDVWTIEMIRPDLQTIAMGQVNVLLVLVINTASTFGRLQVDISHLCLAYSLPEHITLIMAQVNAMNMATCIFTLHRLTAQKPNSC